MVIQLCFVQRLRKKNQNLIWIFFHSQLITKKKLLLLGKYQVDFSSVKAGLLKKRF